MRFSLLVATLALGCASQRAAAPTAPAPAASSPGLPTGAALKTGAEAAREAKDWKRMQTLYRELARQEPQNAEALAYAGMASVVLGERKVGVEELERSIAVKDAASTRYIAGSVLREDGELERARAHYERAVALDASAVRAWHDLAMLRAQMVDLDAAFAAAERVKALAPDARSTDELLMLLGQFSSAMSAGPEAGQHGAQGLQALSEGREDEALKELEEAVRVAPTYADAQYNLGILLRRKGELARAEQAYRTALQHFAPREAVPRADAQNNLSDLLVSRGAKGAEPLQLARAAIAVRGERPSYLDTLARACDAQGDRACAAEAFQKLLASGGELPPAVKAHAEERVKVLAK